MSSEPKKLVIGSQHVQVTKDGKRIMMLKNNSETKVPPTQSGYLETRFENDIKTLISRADRLESLMERLLEANLANTELIGEMFKDVKMFMVTKRVQNSTQLHERPGSNERPEASSSPTEQHVDSGTSNNERQFVTSAEVVLEEETPTKFLIKKDLTKQKVSMEIKGYSEDEWIPVEVLEEPEPEDETNYDDEKGPEEEHEYLEEVVNDDEVLQSKTFLVPLKTLEEVMIFDQELKTSETFQHYMKGYIQPHQPVKEEKFRLESLINSIIDKKLIKKVGLRKNKSRIRLQKTYLCDTFLYENFASAHMSRKDYYHELNFIFLVNTLPTTNDPDGFNLPLEQQSELKALEGRLKDPEEREKFIQKLTNISAREFKGNLKGKPLIVNFLSNILGVQLIMMHNWDGKHGKRSLSEYRTIFTDCLKTVVDMEYDEFETNLRKAIRTLQNREHIHISRVKKRLSTFVIDKVETLTVE